MNIKRVPMMKIHELRFLSSTFVDFARRWKWRRRRLLRGNQLLKQLLLSFQQLLDVGKPILNTWVDILRANIGTGRYILIPVGAIRPRRRTIKWVSLTYFTGF